MPLSDQIRSPAKPSATMVRDARGGRGAIGMDGVRVPAGAAVTAGPAPFDGPNGWALFAVHGATWARLVGASCLGLFSTWGRSVRALMSGWAPSCQLHISW